MQNEPPDCCPGVFFLSGGLFRVSVDVPLDAVDDHFEGDQVLAALRDDQIRVFLARLDIELVHGLDGGHTNVFLKRLIIYHC